MSKERPIIFDAESVRAILSGSKTQTRRVVKPQPPDGYYTWYGITPDEFQVWANHPQQADKGDTHHVRCPYGAPGDRLWVREAWRLWAWDEDFSGASIGYKDAKCKWCDFPHDDYERWLEWLIEESNKFEALPGVAWNEDEGRYDIADKSVIPWRSPIHMPRWASRITLEITGVRVERVKDITEEDAIAEGVARNWLGADCPPEYLDEWKDYNPLNKDGEPCYSARDSFRSRWDEINARRGFGWQTNPYVWCISFRRIDDAVA